jgi:putative spermidine/putrescine transport system permease protein
MAEQLTAGTRAGRGLAWAGFAAYFLVPLAASIYFTFSLNGRVSVTPYTGLFSADGFAQSLQMSVGMGLLTVAILLALLLPAMIAIQLSLPGLRGLVETLCTLPLVIPPISFVAGIIALQNKLADDPYSSLFQFMNRLQQPGFPLLLVFSYVILALPFAYRALDAGLRMLALRTLVDAARGLGASWPTVLIRVIMPNLRTGILNATILTFALVLGEFTVANLLGFTPFPVWIVNSGGGHGQQSTAASILSLLLTWGALLILSVVGDRRSKAARSAS